MNSWNFTLVVTAPHTRREIVEDFFYEAGCDDACIHTLNESQLVLDFDRQAESEAEAIGSAISNVTTALNNLQNRLTA